MYDPLNPQGRVAHGLNLGRPANRRYRYRGNRPDIVAQPELKGPDAHGVSWWPVRSYYEEAEDKTLVVYEPVHPDNLAEKLSR